MPFNFGPSMGMMRNRFGPGGGGSFNERPMPQTDIPIGSPGPMPPPPNMGGGGMVPPPSFLGNGGIGMGRPPFMPMGNSGITGGMPPRGPMMGGGAPPMMGGLFSRYNRMQGAGPQMGVMPPRRQMY